MTPCTSAAPFSEWVALEGPWHSGVSECEPRPWFSIWDRCPHGIPSVFTPRSWWDRVCCDCAAERT